MILLFKPIIFSDYIPCYSSFYFFNIISTNYFAWKFIRLLFTFSSFFVLVLLFHYFFKFLIKQSSALSTEKPSFGILVGKDLSNKNIYIPENSLYQNILITGAIGSGKTASAMYPFTKQLINYMANDFNKKLGFLILDVKGNYYSKVMNFAVNSSRQKDVIVIELNGKYRYNPLDKPNLKASVLANRLKTILLLFSPNNSESYWLDIAESILESCINFCRIYNNGYVNFEEIHKLVTDIDYYNSKIKDVRPVFLSVSLLKNRFMNYSLQ